MTDFTALIRPDRGEPAATLLLMSPARLDEWMKNQPETVRIRVTGQKFRGHAHQIAILGEAAAFALIGTGPEAAPTSGSPAAPRISDPWLLAHAATALPGGVYRLEGGAAEPDLLGWLLAQHRFDAFRTGDTQTPEAESALAEARAPRILLTKSVAQIGDLCAEAAAVAHVRDLVNCPANQLGPAELEALARTLAQAHGADVTVTRGEALAREYPLIQAVGQGAEKTRAPRLIELVWGDPDHPRIALIGKGITFDTGGLDIKPSSAMRLMKKDMGGAAHALALAERVMGEKLPVRLHLLIPAAENAVDAHAMRPGDVYASRKGLTVEITNTDAEGRLILADALTRAMEVGPELVIDFATLTGAARVALGPDLPALFASDEALAAALLAEGVACGDPLWRLPLHAGYADMMASDIADLNNSPDGGFAGAITAALFLQRFVSPGTPWAHIDTFAWRPAAKPGRPKGGEALGLRAVWRMLRGRYASSQ